MGSERDGGREAIQNCYPVAMKPPAGRNAATTPPTCPPRICAATAWWLAVTSGWLVSRRRVCIGRCDNVVRVSTACLQCKIKRKSRRAQRGRFCKVGITRRPIAGRMLWGRGRERRARAEGGESDGVAAMPLVAQLRVCDANLKADTAVRNATCLQQRRIPRSRFYRIFYRAEGEGGGRSE